MLSSGYEFLTITVIAMLAIISPGPAFAIVMKNSLSHGRKSGLHSAMGIALGDICYMVINLLGVGVLIAQSKSGFLIVKNLGALYLLYIGFKGVCAKKATQQELLKLTQDNPHHATKRRSIAHEGFKTAFLTNILNPKVCLFYLSFFSVVLPSDMSVPTQVFYCVWLSILVLGWFSGVALFFTNARISTILYGNKHWIERVTGSILMLLGMKLLFSEL